jgi:hypothetical protein
MPREAGLEVGRAIVAEIVQQQERIEPSVSPKPESSAQFHPAPSMVGLTR